MIKVTCEAPTYNEPAKPNIKIHNHWNGEDKVEIEINGERYVVKADDIIKAINNCTNIGRHW